MARTTRLALTFAVAIGLAAPSWAWAQAVRRTDPPAGGSSSGGSSGGSSSSSSSGGESRVSTPPPPPVVRDPEPQRSRTPPPSSPRTGSATSRSNPNPTTTGSSGSSSSTVRSRGSSDTSSTSGTNVTRSGDSAIGRDRGSRPITGQAVERRLSGGSPGGLPILIINPWDGWYGNSYYGLRYGCGLYCRNYYDPFSFWYSPYSRYGNFGFYDPFFDPYGYGPGYSSSGRYYDEEPPSRRVGSLRIKANVKEAKIYIDGVLVGAVDDFDGMTNHLELDAGPHQLEVRAEGYQTLVKDVSVVEGKTLTERLSIKRK
jgi:hypothetical protein